MYGEKELSRMELTVRSVLQMPEYSDVTLVAGSGGLDRIVTGANIIEVPTVTHWMEGGELLFSSGFAFGGKAGEGCRLLAELNDFKIAALFLKTGSYLKSIDEAMIQTANKLNFPLLSVPEDRPYSHYIDPVYALLINQKAKVLEISNTICDHLFGIAVDDSYFSLCQYVSESLRQPVYLLDGKGKVLIGNGYTLKAQYEDAFSEIIKRSDHEVSFINHLSIADSELESARVVFIPIESPHHVIKYLVAIETVQSDHELCCAVLPFVARIIQIQELHHYSLLQQENKIAGDLFADILEKRYEDHATIYQRGKLLNIDLTEPLVVAVIHLNRSAKASILEPPNDARDDELRRFIRERIMMAMPRVLFLDHERTIICLIQTKSDTERNEVADIIQRACKLDREFEHYSLHIGVSRKRRGIEHVPRLNVQANIAGRVAHASCETDSALRLYDELGLQRLYPDLRKSNELKLLVAEVLGPLMQYDRLNHTHYFTVLAEYCKHNGVLSQAAKALFIHNNTMSKYLKAIEDILKRDLRDYRSLSEVMFCLEFYRLLRE